MPVLSRALALLLLPYGAAFLVLGWYFPQEVVVQPEISAANAFILEIAVVAYVLLSSASKFLALIKKSKIVITGTALVFWMVFFFAVVFTPFSGELKAEWYRDAISGLIFIAWPIFDLYDLWIQYVKKMEALFEEIKLDIKA